MRHLRTFRGPFWPFLFLSLKSCYVCYSCDFSDSRYLVFLASNKNPCYFRNFATFADFSGPFLAFSLSKSRNFVTFVIFAIFVIGVFSWQEKSLLLLRFLQHLRTFRGPSFLLLFLSLEFCYICYFCDFCDICPGCFKLQPVAKVLETLYRI